MPLDVAVIPPFLIASLLLAISPGPDLVLVSSYSSTRGFRAGVLVACGIAVAGLVQTVVVALGLATVMASTPQIATAIRAAGALYFLVAGLRLLLSRKSADSNDARPSPPTNRDGRLVAHGAANNLLNPKALLFFSVFLPQFATGAGPTWAQLLTLGLLLTATAFVVNLSVAFGFSRIAARLGGALRATGRRVEIALGLVFIGLSARLATSR